MSSDIRGVELKIQFPHGSTRNFNFSFFNLYRNFTERTGGIPSDFDKGLSAAALSLYARLSRRVLYMSRLISLFCLTVNEDLRYFSSQGLLCLSP